MNVSTLDPAPHGAVAPPAATRTVGTIQPVVIIGAGLSGLAAAHALERCGADARILESAPRPAEAWRRRYPALRLNTHRHYSRLPGAPPPPGKGPFATRDEIIDYLEDYAAGLRHRIAYGVRVARIDPVHGHWRLVTSAGERRAHHVIVATGRERVPVMPAWPGARSFRGRLIHAADFDAAERYRDQRVLVVGGGNSGIDILNHLVRVPTRALYLSLRSGPTILPSRFCGVAVQRLSGSTRRLPTAVADLSMALTERLAFGSLQRYGIPRRALGAATRVLRDGVAPAFDRGFVRALKQGRVSVVPTIASFDQRDVLLSDGRRLADIDTVIAATGYRPGLEDLLGHLGVLGPSGMPRVGGATPCPDLPGLWFIGMHPGFQGHFHSARVNSRRLARRIRRDLHRAARMLA